MISRFLSGLVLACLATLVLTVPALGHAELVESDPPDGGTIQTLGGYTLTATFSEDLLAGSNILVRDSAGDEVASGGVDPDDATVLTAELPELDPGDYVARWTASTADGHTERGNINFTVDAATPTPTEAPTPTSTPEPTAPPSELPSATASPAPTASEAPSATPSPAPTNTPTPTAAPGPTDPTSSNDIILALVLAGIAVGGVVAFIFFRGKR